MITQVAPDGSAEYGTVDDPEARLRPFAASSAAVVTAAVDHGEAIELGAETVRGTEATHHRIEPDDATRRALGRSGLGALAWFRLDDVERVTSIDVWVADELIRRTEAVAAFGDDPAQGRWWARWHGRRRHTPGSSGRNPPTGTRSTACRTRPASRSTPSRPPWRVTRRSPARRTSPHAAAFLAGGDRLPPSPGPHTAPRDDLEPAAIRRHPAAIRRSDEKNARSRPRGRTGGRDTGRAEGREPQAFGWAHWAPANEFTPIAPRSADGGADAPDDVEGEGDGQDRLGGPDDARVERHAAERADVMGRRARVKPGHGPATPPDGVRPAPAAEFEDFWHEAERKLTSRVERRAVARFTPPQGTPVIRAIPAEFFAGSGDAPSPGVSPLPGGHAASGDRPAHMAPPERTGPPPGPAPAHATPGGPTGRAPAAATPPATPPGGGRPPRAARRQSAPPGEGAAERDRRSVEENAARRRAPAPWYRTGEQPAVRTGEVPAVPGAGDWAATRHSGEEPAVPGTGEWPAARHTLHSGEVAPAPDRERRQPPRAQGPAFHAGSGEYPVAAPPGGPGPVYRPDSGEVPAADAEPVPGPRRWEPPGAVAPVPVPPWRSAPSGPPGPPPPLPHRRVAASARGAVPAPLPRRRPVTPRAEAPPPPGRPGRGPIPEQPAFMARSGEVPAVERRRASPVPGGDVAPLAPGPPGAGTRGPRSHEIPAVPWADDPFVAAYPGTQPPLPPVRRRQHDLAPGGSSWNEADRAGAPDDDGRGGPACCGGRPRPGARATQREASST